MENDVATALYGNRTVVLVLVGGSFRAYKFVGRFRQQGFFVVPFVCDVEPEFVVCEMLFRVVFHINDVCAGLGVVVEFGSDADSLDEYGVGALAAVDGHGVDILGVGLSRQGERVAGSAVYLFALSVVGRCIPVVDIGSGFSVFCCHGEHIARAALRLQGNRAEREPFGRV